MTQKPDAAMIFAAGFGTRMKPMTLTVPKPMLHLAGRPMIDHSVDLVRGAGISRIFANTHHLREKIAPHLSELGVTELYEFPEILETGGGLKSALPLLGPNPVVTLNPDAAWSGPNPIETLMSAWRPEMRALLLLVPLAIAGSNRSEGDFSLEHGVISRSGDFLYTGAQIIRTDGLAEIPESVFSLNRYWDHLAAGGPLHGVVFPGRWCDIGNPEGLALAERLIRHV